MVQRSESVANFSRHKALTAARQKKAVAFRRGTQRPLEAAARMLAVIRERIRREEPGHQAVGLIDEAIEELQTA